MLLKDCIEIKNGKDYSNLSKGDIPVYGTGGVFKYVDHYLYDGSALLLPRKGSLNNVMYIEQGKFWTVDTMFYAICKNNEVNLKYIYYYLTLFNISKLDVGSTVPSMTTSLYYQIDIPLPNIQTQNKIVEVLSNIDSQINRNNHISKSLQVLAQTTYSRWFNQFEFPNGDGLPYKSSGGKMIWNNELKREIPENWNAKMLGDLLTKNTEKLQDYNNIPTIDLSVMQPDNFALGELNTSNNFTTNLFVMHKGDLMFGSIRPYLHKAGIAPCDGAFAGTVHSYKPIDNTDYNVCLSALISNDIFSFAVKNAKGTKMPVIASDDLLQYKIPYNKGVSKQFTKLLDIKNIVCNCMMQNNMLVQLKNNILPLLINGQLNI